MTSIDEPRDFVVAIMSIEELLEQMEQYRLRREQRDYRPQWLKQFIHQAAELFEPLAHDGRVGCDSRLDDRGWLVRMYLGATETVGGALDGDVQHAAFRLDLTLLGSLFESVQRFEWYSLTTDRPAVPVQTIPPRSRSLITIAGTVTGNHEMKLELLATPPEEAGPGLHVRPDGTISVA
ncbi:MAG: hypothetical protein KDA96_05885 [Planctomycetaceae bacterium]|nr:hypothetical protein [Planctomycetaceae bacterium]